MLLISKSEMRLKSRLKSFGAWSEKKGRSKNVTITPMQKIKSRTIKKAHLLQFEKGKLARLYSI